MSRAQLLPCAVLACTLLQPLCIFASFSVLGQALWCLMGQAVWCRMGRALWCRMPFASFACYSELRRTCCATHVLWCCHRCAQRAQ
jgi:hypothetical protein